MGACKTCGNFILFGGMKHDGKRYCSGRCLEQARVATVEVPPEILEEAVRKVFRGNCPRCGQSGPVDVFTSHKVSSFIAVTTWKDEPAISCRGCGTKRQLGGLLYSFLLGWWGLPWGFVMTPVQIGRNLVGLSKRIDGSQPSPRLEPMVRAQLAAAAVAQGIPTEHAA